MEELAEAERVAAPAATVAAGTRVRRRLVQSMLFPANGAIVEKESTENEEEDEAEGEEEWCGSQSGRGRKRKGNQTRNSKPRGSQKAKTNGKDTLKKKVGDGDSEDVSKSVFFVKVSEKQHKKRERKQQVCTVSIGVDDNVASNGVDDSIPSNAVDGNVISNGVDDNVASPPTAAAACGNKTSRQANSTPKKQRMNTTPKKTTSTPKKKAMSTPRKKAMGSGSKGAASGQTPADLMKTEPTPQTAPNLRLEAKFMAEENSRIYAGKQIHPFFSSRKVDKRSQETVDLEMEEQCSSEREGKGITFNPVHIFERVENDTVAPDWGHWTFVDTSVYDSSGLGSGASTLYERSVNSLSSNNFLSFSHSSGTSLCEKEMSMDPSLHIEDPVTNRITIHDDPSCITYDAEWQGRFCQGSCQNCLWTDKYQPKMAVQVCGNGEVVKRLSEWLHLWHEKCFQIRKSIKSDDRSIAEDADFYYNYSDCDSEDIDEEAALENVLLVTGPVGSGKSAAIYACAKEQGFQVIEINASDWRNGALVKQKFGEAVESHWLQGTMVNPTTPKSQHLSNSLPVSMSKGADSKVIELIPSSDEEDFDRASAGLRESFHSENRTAIDKSKVKTLILFEDVDATFYEDSGFISTIQQLAKTAKRPMILTSNSENPLLPNNLDRLHLCFTLPSLEELNVLANLVCVAEKARMHSSMMEHFVKLCQRDIRKTIMNLQFWCQGQYLRGNDLQSTDSPHLFDLDAYHRVLPKIIPWGYPSPLSEHVEEEITKALMMMDENNNLMEIDNEEELDRNLQKSWSMPVGNRDYIEAKKEALLSLHCSMEDEDELATPFDTICDFYSSQESPVADTQPGLRRKFSAIIFSDSEEDNLTDRNTVASRRMLVNADDDDLDLNITAPSSSLLGETWCSPSTNLLNQFEGEMLEKSFYQHAKTSNCTDINDPKAFEGSLVQCSLMNDTCEFIEVSCVPESSMVPETEYDNQTNISSKTVSYGHASCRADADSMRDDPPLSLVAIEGKKCNESLPELDGAQEILGSSCHFNTTKSVNEEVMGDSQIDRVIEVPVGLMPFEGESCFNFLPPSDGTQVMLGSSCHLSTKSASGEVVGGSQFNGVIDVPVGYQVLDECSRMDFIRTFRPSPNLISHQQIDFVQETWKRLRECKMDLRQYATPQEKDALQVMKVNNGFVNLISDADLLLKDCQPLLSDSLDPLMISCDESLSHSWHDDQLQMSNSFAEHGICFYAKETAALGSKVGTVNGVDLAWEMLASSTSPMALGKLVSQKTKQINSLDMRLPGDCAPLKSKRNSHLMDVLQSVVPSKSYLSLQGNACHEYLSSLSQISRLQASRLSECDDNRRHRRGRVERHYLSSGKFSLTSEDISLLGEYNHYQKVSPQSKDPIPEFR